MAFYMLHESLTLKKQMFPVKEQVPGNGKTLEGPVLKSLVIASNHL